MDYGTVMLLEEKPNIKVSMNGLFIRPTKYVNKFDPQTKIFGFKNRRIQSL